MKLRQTSTQPQTSDQQTLKLKKPNPPTKEAIQKAQFIDKSFAWRNDARI